jgi:hypothetical protein
MQLALNLVPGALQGHFWEYPVYFLMPDYAITSQRNVFLAYIDQADDPEVHVNDKTLFLPSATMV